MNDCKTLRELCNIWGVTRRAVQGYEKAGLVSASEKNKYGHLLYDVKTQNRIASIKLYQQLGFKIKEIQEIIDAPSIVVKDELESKIIRLKEEQLQIEILIEKAYELIEGLNY